MKHVDSETTLMYFETYSLTYTEFHSTGNDSPEKTACIESVFVTFDIIHIYTSLLHEHRMEVIQFWLEKIPDEFSDQIGKEFINEYINNDKD